MKATLIKSEDSYILKDGLNHVLGIDDKKLKDRLECPYLLSKQNCDEIFGVVDVEKLADEITKEYATLTPKAFKRGVALGINKAMELNKDKVFTLEDMRKAFIAGSNVFIEEDDAYGSEFQKEEDNFIQSLQQPTEMNVEIVMDFIPAGNGVVRFITKFDSSGNLILKKI